MISGSSKRITTRFFVAVLLGLVVTAELAYGYLSATTCSSSPDHSRTCPSLRPSWPPTGTTTGRASSTNTCRRTAGYASTSTQGSAAFIRRFLSKPDDAFSSDQEKEHPFTLSSLFGKKSSAPSSKAGGNSGTALRGVAANLDPHPSVRDHVSPLNLLHPGGGAKAGRASPVVDDPLPVHPDVRSGVLSNGLSYVILPNKSPPGRFEAHLQVFSGSCELVPHCSPL